jgi:hypothetical protein
MKAVRHLHRPRRTLPGAFGKRPSTVATHHVQSFPTLLLMLLQPFGKRRRFSIWQQVNDAVLLEIHQQRAVAKAASEGKVIYSQHT